MIRKAATDVARAHRKRAALFSLVGAVNAVTDIAVYAVALVAGLGPVAANVAAFFVANVQSYLINGFVTFRREGRSAPLSVGGYLRFIAAHLVGLAVASIVIAALAPRVGPAAAKAASIVAAAIFNYALSATFVFRRQTAESEPGA